MLIEKFVVATPPETSPVDFGTAVHAEAMRRGLGRAKHVYLVMDGALWLWDLAEDCFAQAIKTLDFHHARDHLWAVANSLHGEDTPEAKAGRAAIAIPAQGQGKLCGAATGTASPEPV